MSILIRISYIEMLWDTCIPKVTNSARSRTSIYFTTKVEWPNIPSSHNLVFHHRDAWNTSRWNSSSIQHHDDISYTIKTYWYTQSTLKFGIKWKEIFDGKYSVNIKKYIHTGWAKSRFTVKKRGLIVKLDLLFSCRCF